MSGAQHHKSKRARYDLLLVPRDDAGHSKSVRFAPWQVYLAICGSVVVLVAAVLALLVYTPVGILIPLENPALVNKYSKDLISLNQRMTVLMEQLLELREYNVKLRKALGERVVSTDSGVTVVGSPRNEKPDGRRIDSRERSTPEVTRTEPLRSAFPMAGTSVAMQENREIVFPAVMPAEGYLTRGFDPSQRHYGLDIAGSTGSLVRASADGIVVFAGWTSNDGNEIILSHPGGFLTFYKHNQSLLVPPNAAVKRGEPIALLGSSGETSAGPHVHFEVWKDGVPVDPAGVVLNFNF
jgi:murein DD-endopeptidase MepM/ murein hydrolase activator NlpD